MINFREIAKDYNNVFGFNVIPLEDKIPKLNWNIWQTTVMDLSDIDKLGWNVRTNGIGAISGIDGLRCLDFDDVEDVSIVYDFAEKLDLGKGYLWIVKSGSGKGYHIWFYCFDEDDYLEGLGGEKAYYKYKLKVDGLCEHLEVRWKNCQTVLPPSLHPSGGKYEFVNVKDGGLPIDGPKSIWIGKLLEMLKGKCVVETSKVKREISETKTTNKKLRDYDEKLLNDAVKFITGGINNYDDWLRIGFALASLDEDGREYFVKISSGNPKYNDSEADLNKKFDRLLKDYSGEITLGTFFEIAKNYGWEKPKKHFWNFEDGAAKINVNELKELLEEEGFGKIYIGNEPFFIRVNENVISDVTIPQIKDYIYGYVDESRLDQKRKNIVKEKLIRSARTILTESVLTFLNTVEPQFVKDKKDKAYFFFRNGFVEVTKDTIEHKPYSKLNGCIWEKQKIDRKYIESDSHTVFKQFLSNVSGFDETRILALKTAIGYCLHGYRNPAITKAIIFIDEKLSENAFGRSGKGLVAEAVSQIRNLLKIDGKNFRFDKAFAFQSVNLDTEIIFFDDVKKNFHFEKLFSILTGGLTVEKKNRNEFNIPFDEVPKVLIATNYSIQGSDDSSRDRQFVIEFADYYNAKHKPTDDFEKLFFNEWDGTEFAKFDNFMMECCQLYLREGLCEYDYVNLTRKKLIDETEPEFEEFIRELELNKEYSKKDLFKRFQEEYPDFDKLKQHTFTKWTKVYANLYDLDVHERKSGKDRYFALVKKGEEFIPLPDFGQIEGGLGI
ncbi:hypothetical protein ASZ90_003492 [hydrocarbon metagenome]|uniref:DNA primase/polymerase bifunctional N-terminal domain-containing protein n=1 Tax=hydrocarbon metagenome TaxID=938273 RepID=A0A0W8G149_9ZZZZ